jgi:hypothetical protein
VEGGKQKNSKKGSICVKYAKNTTVIGIASIRSQESYYTIPAGIAIPTIPDS